MRYWKLDCKPMEIKVYNPTKKFGNFFLVMTTRESPRMSAYWWSKECGTTSTYAYLKQVRLVSTSYMILLQDM